ncbi:MAG: hypothetical protein RLZZ70_567 [Candidatus Parcubacteria bacterium]|jgi:GMP synthase-like glutamine amidotransferase
MRVLIVNNGMHYPTRIDALFPEAEVEVLPALEVPQRYPVAPHDLIVLSGSNAYPIPYFHHILADLLAWIPRQTQPLLGICYGAELLVEAYGGTLHHLGPEQKLKGFFTYEVPPNPLAIPSPLCVYEGHQWIIESVKTPLYPILASPRGVLLFGHTTRPHIGTIFHLEKFPKETDGLLVFQAIMKHFGLSAG